MACHKTSRRQARIDLPIRLVAANIFPGDMLWKKFGITRHGKVVFYDYDEIEYITDCNFRNDTLRAVFMKHHGDLLEAAFWQSHKERIAAGYVHDVFPYERERRFVSKYAVQKT